jgi:hypothetical protein
LRIEFSVAQCAAGAIFQAGNYGSFITAIAQQVLGKIKLCTLKPLGAGKPIAML